jgi:hypothetical protein
VIVKRKYKKGLGFNKYYITKPEQVMAGVISTAPYKNWQEWLDSEESKKVMGN